MPGFDDRKKAQETQFVLDQEKKFKANARRNKLLGLWAAEKLGLTGEAAADYAKAVVMSDVEEVGDHDVFRKVKADFDAKNVNISEHRLRREMDDLMKLALEQLQSGG